MQCMVGQVADFFHISNFYNLQFCRPLSYNSQASSTSYILPVYEADRVLSLLRSKADSRNHFSFICCRLPLSMSLTLKAIFPVFRNSLCFRLIQISSNLFKLVQLGSNLSNLVQNCPKWSKHIQIGLNLFKK